MVRLLPPLLLLALLAGCAKPVTVTSPQWDAPPTGSFLAMSGHPLDDQDIVGFAREKDFILIGESHTNPCDHAVQTRIIEALAAEDTAFAIGLEMLPVTAQHVLDRFNARQITAENLGREVEWEKLWGYPYSLYKPIFVLAENHNLPVVALNIPRAVLTRFRDHGKSALTAEEQALLPSRIIDASPAQKKALKKQVGLHQTMREFRPDSQPEKGAERESRVAPPSKGEIAEKFYLVQSLWDSMMAEQALRWRDRLGLPMIILAGAGHVEFGWGIEYRIRTLAPAARCLAVVPLRDREDFLEQQKTELRPMTGETVFFHCAAQHKSRMGMTLVFEHDQVLVDSVDVGSVADKAGLRAGDVLIAAGEKKLSEATDLHFAAMTASRRKMPLTLNVLRDGRHLTVTLPLH